MSIQPSKEWVGTSVNTQDVEVNGAEASRIGAAAAFSRWYFDDLGIKVPKLDEKDAATPDPSGQVSIPKASTLSSVQASGAGGVTTALNARTRVAHGTPTRNAGVFDERMLTRSRTRLERHRDLGSAGTSPDAEEEEPEEKPLTEEELMAKIGRKALITYYTDELTESDFELSFSSINSHNLSYADDPAAIHTTTNAFSIAAASIDVSTPLLTSSNTSFYSSITSLDNDEAAAAITAAVLSAFSPGSDDAPENVESPTPKLRLQHLGEDALRCIVNFTREWPQEDRSRRRTLLTMAQFPIISNIALQGLYESLEIFPSDDIRRLRAMVLAKAVTVKHLSVIRKSGPSGYFSGYRVWADELRKLIGLVRRGLLAFASEGAQFPNLDRMRLHNQVILPNLARLDITTGDFSFPPRLPFLPSLKALSIRFAEFAVGDECLQNITSLILASQVSDLSLNLHFNDVSSSIARLNSLSHITRSLTLNFSGNSIPLYFLPLALLQASAVTSLSIYNLKSVDELGMILTMCSTGVTSLEVDLPQGGKEVSDTLWTLKIYILRPDVRSLLFLKFKSEGSKDVIRLGKEIEGWKGFVEDAGSVGVSVLVL